jgi:hypothetical protein
MYYSVYKVMTCINILHWVYGHIKTVVLDDTWYIQVSYKVKKIVKLEDLNQRPHVY